MVSTIGNFSDNLFNASEASSVYIYNYDLVLACLMIITFCCVVNLILKLGGMVLK